MEDVEARKAMSSGAGAARMKSEAGPSLSDSSWSDPPPPSPEQVLAGDIHRIALFLDCDGTLVDIAPTPNEVRAPPGLAEVLTRLSHRLNGAIAIITGRKLAEIDTILHPVEFLGAGVHGAELRTVRGGNINRVASALPSTLVDELLRRAQALPGILVEPKGPVIAIHYRQAPHLKDALEASLRSVLTAYPEGLVLNQGRKLFEIIPAGHSKGTALETLLALPDFAGRIPIMIGDDMGDIPAFAAARRLGGAGMRVAGEQFGEENVEFTGPKQVFAWLDVLASRLEAAPRS
jgi:trehalose 6-phosphate phosphatase